MNNARLPAGLCLLGLLLNCAHGSGGEAGKGASMKSLPYSRLIVFGDGLSDQGRFGALTQNRYPPSPPFSGGRWTNGPTWVEVLAAETGTPLSAEDNLAQGGATTGAFNINQPLRDALGLGPDAPIRGVWLQVEEVLRRGKADPAALHVIWAGGHDIGSYLDFGQPDLQAQPPAANIRRAVEALADAGAVHFLVGNMPDMGSTPAYLGTPKAARASELCAAYNQGLAAMAAELRRTRRLDIVEFDGAAAFADIAANAASHGITHLGEAYLPLDYIDFAKPLAPARALPQGRDAATADQYFSFWAVSAGARVHRQLGLRAAGLLRAQHRAADASAASR